MPWHDASPRRALRLVALRLATRPSDPRGAAQSDATARLMRSPGCDPLDAEIAPILADRDARNCSTLLVFSAMLRLQFCAPVELV